MEHQLVEVAQVAASYLLAEPDEQAERKRGRAHD
jgi:hypothetical protein